MQTKLDLLTRIAREDRKSKINNAVYLLNVENLRESYEQLKRGKAAGTDGMSVEEYGEQLESNLEGLVERMKKNAYKPQPVRRVYIPKANGKQRPLGIPSVEDKIVQHALSRILNAIYEVDFLDSSYGFRPGRSCHQALARLDRIIMEKPINHVIDADIKGFFDNVNHEWMMKFLGHRISDPNLLRLIGRFLRNGYMDDGVLFKTEKGTPQGGIISPVLANIYLHYVLDLWIEHKVRKACRGVVEMVRYADDFIICVQYKEEAQMVLELLKARIEGFGLELSQEKTRILEFGRHSWENAKKKGLKPGTFNFLGFTHYAGKSRKGYFLLGRKIEGRKMREKLKELNQWLKRVKDVCEIRIWWKVLRAKIAGYYQYYCVSGNCRSMSRFHYWLIRLVFKWVNRRSQKKSFNWKQFSEYLRRYPLPRPKLCQNLYLL